MTQPAIRAVGVHKTYRGRGGTAAVRGIDLEVRQGEVFGLLGPNGAGKTTAVAMMCTLTAPTRGRIEVAGHDAAAAAPRVRRAIGVVFQESTLDGELTAEENLRFHGELYALPGAAAAARTRELLGLVGLADRGRGLVRTFSGGMRRRLEIARGLMHRPRVLFLDEPTVGLDPNSRIGVWEHLREVRTREDTTLFLTTHYLEEAEECDRIAIMDAGRIVAEGTPAGLKTAVGADRIELRTGDDRAAARALRDRLGVAAETPSTGGVLVRSGDGAALVPRLCAALDVQVHAVTVTRPSLDEVFLHHTGHRIRSGGAGAQHAEQVGAAR
ncbi:ABC transporter ATP-binding protein [Nocardiopsis composta]|uniref:ABC-2 type transport system ATP-binding protein n=1 Tax=Nocardiopsis composta TaxID=157465 RepID=A0A7W8QIR5_9ACTN|nr:ATP-binding cassette domain-containing protein [Nocardiopsis composta]MBB5430470.1 ABC-2 type transport system ATP-binding protein [Nocardiopsis composta]